MSCNYYFGLLTAEPLNWKENVKITHALACILSILRCFVFNGFLSILFVPFWLSNLFLLKSLQLGFGIYGDVWEKNKKERSRCQTD